MLGHCFFHMPHHFLYIVWRRFEFLLYDTLLDHVNPRLIPAWSKDISAMEDVLQGYSVPPACQRQAVEIHW